MHHWDVGLCEPAQKPYHPSHFQNYALHMHKLIAIHNGFLYDICRNDYRLINSVGAPFSADRGSPRSDAPTVLPFFSSIAAGESFGMAATKTNVRTFISIR